MKFKTCVSIFLLLTNLIVFSQDNLYSALTIPKELKENANAVLRIDETTIEVSSINSLKHSYRRVITILNENGKNKVNAIISYDNKTNIKLLEAIIYNRFGEKLDRYKKSDFIDVSAVSGGSLYEDNRLKYLEYTPVDYPYTVEFRFETISNNTSYIPFWRPLKGYFISTEKSSYKVLYEKTLGLNKKERNFFGYNIIDNSDDGILNYSVKNIKAIKPEAYSPSFRDFGPKLLISFKKFYYEGYIGSAEDWESLGKWMYKDLLIGRTELSEATKNKIKKLVEGIEDPIEKAKLVYQYVQDNTRYISVQEGVGGMQPISASNVDNVKYGDCKGLSNYTKALLDIVGVESNYTRLYGSSRYQVDVSKDFVSFQGQTNHVILNIPNDGNPIWLECTSQKVPFGHIVNFTDDRDVLVITPEGGRIEHTRVYTSKENYLISKANITLDVNGGFEAEVISKSGGSQYDNRLGRIVDSDQKDRVTYYKKYWSYINGLSLNSIDINNNKDRIEIIEKINIKSPSYAVSAGEKLLIKPNMFNRLTNVPPRYTERKLPFVIQRGFFDEDEYIINLPNGSAIEALLESKEITSQFGVYKVELIKLSESQVKYKRSLEIVKGSYKKEDYKAYRSFRRKIAKADKASFVINKIN